MKGKLKLTGGTLLQSPKSLLTRPTTSKVREALINILGKSINNCHWLDLCSGSGIVGCEAVQKGARRILAIESHKETARICKSNLLVTTSGLSHQPFLEVITSDVVRVLKKGCKKQSKNFVEKFPHYDFRFDFIYIDPPYKSDLYELIFENLLFGNWLKNNGLAICEYSPKFIPSIPSSWKSIKTKTYGNTALVFLTPNQA